MLHRVPGDSAQLWLSRARARGSLGAVWSWGGPLLPLDSSAFPPLSPSACGVDVLCTLSGSP